MTASLEGLRALVTGGTRGIGHAIAERLTADGARVTVTGTRPHGEGPQGCEYRAVDFADREATVAFAGEVGSLDLDILVNNAGINVIGPFETFALEDFERIQRVNVTAPFLLCQAVLPAMKARGWGRIVNISSLWGQIARGERAAYGASKFAIDGMTASLAAEVSMEGILCNSVAPGFIETELSRSILGEEGLARLAQQVAARRCGKVEEVAGLVVFLASPENTYITGQNVTIDGGFTRTRP